MSNCTKCGLPLEEGRPKNARVHLHCGYQKAIEACKSYIPREDAPSTNEHMWKYLYAHLKENPPL